MIAYHPDLNSHNNKRPVTVFYCIETAEQKLKMAKEVDISATLHANQDTENEINESETENIESKGNQKSKKKKGKIKSSSEKNDLPTEKAMQRAADIIEMLKD